MFRVTVINLTEHTNDSWEYEDLLSALKVAKNVDTSTMDDLVAKPAMTDEFFARNIFDLLTHGFVYVRDDVMVFLWNVDEDGIERPVVSPQDFLKGIRIQIPTPSGPPVGENNIVLGTD